MSVAESKTKALLDQGFAQTGVMLRKEDKACIVTDMGRVEWFQVNPWGGVQALSAAPGEPPGIQALMCVISSLHSLRDTAHFSDEEGELTNALCTLRDWAYAQTAAFQPSPKAAPVTQQAGYAEVIECGNSYAKVKLKGEAFGSVRVGDIFYTALQQDEPVAWLNPWRADQVTTDYDAYGERGIPLYTAPRPAPLREREAFERDWEKRHAPVPINGRTHDGRYGDLSIQDAWESWQARAALAAQGGKA